MQELLTLCKKKSKVWYSLLFAVCLSSGRDGGDRVRGGNGGIKNL